MPYYLKMYNFPYVQVNNVLDQCLVDLRVQVDYQGKAGREFFFLISDYGCPLATYPLLSRSQVDQAAMYDMYRSCLSITWEPIEGMQAIWYPVQGHKMVCQRIRQGHKRIPCRTVRYRTSLQNLAGIDQRISRPSVSLERPLATSSNLFSLVANANPQLSLHPLLVLLCRP